MNSSRARVVSTLARPMPPCRIFLVVYKPLIFASALPHLGRTQTTRGNRRIARLERIIVGRSTRKLAAWLEAVFVSRGLPRFLCRYIQIASMVQKLCEATPLLPFFRGQRSLEPISRDVSAARRVGQYPHPI